MTRVRVLVAGFVLAIGGSACALEITVPTPDDGCPRSIAQAAALPDGTDLVLLTAALIRFVPAPDPRFRGYDINVITRDGEGHHRGMFLRMLHRVPGILEPSYALVVAERTDRSGVVVPGRCPPLIPITEAEAHAGWNAD